MRANAEFEVHHCRAGDLAFKDPLRLVECEPDVRRVQLQVEDEFIVVASDGLWDVLSDQDACDIVTKSLHGGGASTQCEATSPPQNCMVCHDDEVGLNSSGSRSVWPLDAAQRSRAIPGIDATAVKEAIPGIGGAMAAERSALDSLRLRGWIDVPWMPGSGRNA